MHIYRRRRFGQGAIEGISFFFFLRSVTHIRSEQPLVAPTAAPRDNNANYRRGRREERDI